MSDRASQTPQRRKAHLLAGELGLTREERIALSVYLLRRDVTSWSQLDEAQTLRILDALEGSQLVMELLRQRV